jgi:hypothetical protein
MASGAKTRAAVVLERQGLSVGVMLERDWRHLYIRSVVCRSSARLVLVN